MEALDKHKRFHEDSLIYIEKLKNGSLADKPKRPKVKLPSLRNDGNGASKKNTKNITLALTKTKQIAGQKGSELNLFFKNHLYQCDSSLSSTRTGNFQAAALDEDEEMLKHAYNLMKFSEANFLEKTINDGLRLKKAYEIYLEIHSKTFKWGEWIEKSIGKSESYSRKFRQVARVLEPYVKFRKLALPFDCIYANIKHIESMFNDHKIAAQWK